MTKHDVTSPTGMIWLLQLSIAPLQSCELLALITYQQFLSDMLEDQDNVCVREAMLSMVTILEKCFNPGYAVTTQDACSKEKVHRVTSPLSSTYPYEISTVEWKDNIDIWPVITFVHVHMYLILHYSPYWNMKCLVTKGWKDFIIFRIDR